MPVRVVCPSCHASFAAADEFAGRAASCPACGAAVPVPAPGAGALAPADAVEVVEDATELPVAEPIPEAVPVPARPKAAPVRDASRPPVSHKLRDESLPESSGLGGAALVLALFAGVCLLCCGGLGFGLYWAFQQAGQIADPSDDGQVEKNPKVTIANYHKLELGMTEAEVEAILGPGQAARASHLARAFAGENDFSRKRRAEWSPKVAQDRALVWVNGDDHLFVAFHGKPGEGGRLQMKEFVVGSGAGQHAGIPDDAEFGRRFGQPGKPKGKGEEPAVEVGALTLIRDYSMSTDVADAKYKGKELTVTNAVFESATGDTATFRENDKSFTGIRLQVHFAPGQREELAAFQRGDRVKFKARCEGRSDRTIVMRQARLVP